MAIDKLTYPIIINEIGNQISQIQYGNPKSGDIGLAKVNILYKATTKKLNKAILIDIRKAFDTIDREILRDIIAKNLIPEASIDLLLDIVDLYDSIDLNIQGSTIHQKIGIPQGTVYGPLFFMIVSKKTDDRIFIILVLLLDIHSDLKSFIALAV